MNGATVEGPLPDASRMSPTTRWILSRLNSVVARSTRDYDDFQFAMLSMDALFHFAWDEVSRLVRRAVQDDVPAGGEPAESASGSLGEVLDVT
ncbi:hypothetical protein GCM10023238_28880 [Streptomyces heliomycini]